MIQLVTPKQQLPEPVQSMPAAVTPAKAAAPGRKKLPAYGKALLLNRTGGFHPMRTNLIFGDDWRLGSETKQKEDAARAAGMDPYGRAWLLSCGDPVLALRPREFVRGAIDWRLVTASYVVILDQTETESTPDSSLLWLAAEIAHWAGEVAINNQGPPRFIKELAFCSRGPHAEGGAWSWPLWWSDELEKIHERRSGQWYADAFRIVGAGSVTG